MASESKSFVAFYLEKLYSVIPSTGSHDFVFRGLENKDWGLQSTAYLRHANPPPHDDFIDYNCKLIAKAKNANYHIKENSELEEIELLAELRHYGAATALIDFTRDFHVALWFASRSYKKNEIETDGKVFIINIGDVEVFLQLTSDDKRKSLEEILRFKTREKLDTPEGERSADDASTTQISIQKKPELWYWQPRFAINHRLSAQKGVFIFGKATIDTADIEYWEVIIPKEDKEVIHRELSILLGINEDSLFNDIPGFAEVNDKYHKIQTKSAVDYSQDAVQNRQRGEFEQAVQSIGKAIELDPNNAVYYSFRGVTNLDLKNYEGALRDFTKAAGFNPDEANHHFLRGTVNHNLKNNEDALKDFTKGIELNPNNADNYYFRGQAYRELGKQEDALTDFTKAIELSPDDSFCHYCRSQVYHELGKQEDALEDLTKAIELDPDKSFYYFYRGQAYHKLGKQEEAQQDFAKARILSPPEPPSQDN